MGTGPGQVSLSIKRTALTKSSVVSFLYHCRPCNYSQRNAARTSSWGQEHACLKNAPGDSYTPLVVCVGGVRSSCGEQLNLLHFCIVFLVT